MLELIKRREEFAAGYKEYCTEAYNQAEGKHIIRRCRIEL